MKKILIVDDELDIAELISDILMDEGFETEIITDSTSVISHVKNNKYDLILLDIMMPDISGIDICKEIRDMTNTPIIFITAKSSTISKIVGLELGADDYITKPFINEELVARIKAHIRRDNRTNNNSLIEIKDLSLNRDSFEIIKNNQKIELSTREFELLDYLMTNAGIVLSKEQIFESVWGTNFGDIGTIAVNIKSLRDKLGPDYIKTVWGVGYKFIRGDEIE